MEILQITLIRLLQEAASLPVDYSHRLPLSASMVQLYVVHSSKRLGWRGETSSAEHANYHRWRRFVYRCVLYSLSRPHNSRIWATFSYCLVFACLYVRVPSSGDCESLHPVL